MLTITMKIISEVAKVMEDIMGIGIRIDWLDRLVSRSTMKGASRACATS